MKKVLHLFPAYKIGGAPINVLRLIKGTENDICHYVAASNEDQDFFDSYKKQTKQSVNLQLTKISLKTVYKLIIFVLKIKPDIIHANGKGGALYAFILFPFVKGSFFYTLRGYHVKYSGVKQKIYILFENLFSKVCEKVIAVSESEKKLFLKVTGICDKKVVVIGNGVQIQKDPLPINFGKVNNKYKYNCVTLSRIDKIKDLATMLEAFNLLGRKDTALHIMGGYLSADLKYKSKIEKLISSLSCSNNIYLWGDVKNAANYLHHYDVFISTSLSEGLPTAIIEAGLSNVLVVASDCNGNIDLVRDMETGYLFKKKDVKKLGKILKHLFIDFDCNQNHEIIDNNFLQSKKYSIENHCFKIAELYNSTTNIENTSNK